MTHLQKFIAVFIILIQLYSCENCVINESVQFVCEAYLLWFNWARVIVKFSLPFQYNLYVPKLNIIRYQAKTKQKIHIIDKQDKLYKFYVP